MFALHAIGGMARLLRISGGWWASALLQPISFAGAVLVLQSGIRRSDIYNILWALVFGFATLNILSLVTRRFEPNRNRMSMGELLAVLTVVVAVVLLGFEMLHIFKILPLRLPIR